MRFYPLPHRTWPIPTNRHDVAYLVPDKWDDWFTYETRNSLYYVDSQGEVVDVGNVKVAQFGMGRQRSVEFPKSFRTMDGIFSLGQDVSYYEALNELSADTRVAILEALGDIVYDEDLYDRALDENVTGVSLMRYVSASTVEQQFRRALMGGERLERYVFSFKYPEVPRAKSESPSLRFEVTPGSVPPSNVHAIIGRNGVGKTFLLENLAKCLVPELAEGNEPLGEVRVHTGSLKFAGVTSVTFSAFDAFEPLSQTRNRTSGPDYTYIGLKAVRKGDARRRRSRLLPRWRESLARVCVHAYSMSALTFGALPCKRSLATRSSTTLVWMIWRRRTTLTSSPTPHVSCLND